MRTLLAITLCTLLAGCTIDGTNVDAVTSVPVLHTDTGGGER